MMVVMKTSAQLILIDLECTCDRRQALPSEQMEIIEIGVVVGALCQAGFIAVDQLQLYVRPQWHPRLTPFCTELTGIEQAVVDGAPVLAGALTRLAGFIAQYQPAAWLSWGEFDRRQLVRETTNKKLGNPLASPTHVNVRHLVTRCSGHPMELPQALALAGLRFVGRQHSGQDDALNMGRLIHGDARLRRLLMQQLPTRHKP